MALSDGFVLYENFLFHGHTVQEIEAGSIYFYKDLKEYGLIQLIKFAQNKKGQNIFILVS